MRQRTVTATRHSPAPVEDVWHLLATTATWPSWAPVRDAMLERGGDTDAEGVGAVRAFTTALGTTRERVVAADAPHHLGYELLSGIPVRDYRADVHLAADPQGGTDITWTSTFTSGLVWHALVGLIVRRFAAALATAARRPAAA